MDKMISQFGRKIGLVPLTVGLESLLAGLIGLYVLFIWSQLLLNPQSYVAPLIAVGVMAIAILFLVRSTSKWWSRSPQLAVTALAVSSGVFIAMAVAYLYLISDSAQAAKLALLGAGAACYFLRRRTVVGVLIITLVAVAVAAFIDGPVLELFFFSLGILGSTGLRLHNEIHGHQLKQALGIAQAELERRRQAEDQLRRQEERYRLVAHGTNDGWWDWDLETNRIYFSPRWKQMLGYQEEEIGSDPDEWFQRVHSDDLVVLQARINHQLESRMAPESGFRAEYRILQKDGSYSWVVCRGVALSDKTGRVVRMAGSQTDITRHKLSEQRLHHQAYHDQLTGLPNRTVLIQKLEIALNRLRVDAEYRFAVLFLDLDRFKVINDSLGHLIGDELLRSVSRRLSQRQAPINTISRLGGDEFAILIDNIQNSGEALLVGNWVRDQFREPFVLGGEEIFITPSVGVAFGSKEYQKAEDLLRDSDAAMYQAKKEGRNRCELFQQKMHANAVNLLHLENDLRKAVANGEFCLHYQPIVSLSTKRIHGLEALIRWNHPEQGLLLPGDFLKVAEETGLIIPVYWWALGEACRFTGRVREQIKSLSDLRISVNLSGHQCAANDLATWVQSSLELADLPPQALCLEITEGVLMNQAKPALETLQSLQQQGVQIHLDDFGTGYSSLGYLNQFTFNALKIDRSFIHSLAANGENMKIVRAMVELAHNLSMEVVVEGLETQEQIDNISAIKGDLGQGYYYSPPLSETEVEQLLQDQPVLRRTSQDYWRKTG